MIKKITIIMSLFMSCVLLNGSFIHAAPYEQEFVVRPDPILAGGADRLNLRFSINNARVAFTLSEDPTFIVKVLVRYGSKELTPISSESFSGGAFSVGFSSGAETAPDIAAPLHDWEIQIGRYDLETTLTLDLSGVQAKMDLGGMPLETLVLNLKGARATLDFSMPTLFSVRNLDMSCEGAFFTFANIGNTKFEKFLLTAVGSSVDLDFKGAYPAGDYNADFTLNGSGARISLPATAGALVLHRPENQHVALVGGGWVNEQNVSSPGYMTDDYDDRECRLNLNILSAGASVQINREGKNLHYQLSY